MLSIGQGDISHGLEAVPVRLEEGVEPPDFKYTPENVVGPGAGLDPTEVMFPGCRCQTTPCSGFTCQCLHHGDNYEHRFLKVDEATGVTSRPIFECNVMCTCGELCPNRVVQWGLQTHLLLFRTERKGLGVRSLARIRKGQFVCEYAGEVLGLHEARRRISQQQPSDSNYLIAVREHLHSGQVMETFIDPANTGNIGRFLNHSCSPNLVMVPVRVDSMVPKLALFAAQDIQAGEELCYDYSGRFQNFTGSVKGQEESAKVRVPQKPCHCGAKSCSGSLPYEADLYHGSCEEDSGPGVA
ncbi:hypothetical protein NDU88_007897 [Pleurodeles waltl]|uniref:Histone-lysine N-methyltransferase SETMAR n=2 Tax=Pleurodeles waltl TaxID=8319 RepID=A0AAV7N4R7_PLEWA|nr:hypothetical protein NDU88_007897 [Pleurodeles waltl]